MDSRENKDDFMATCEEDYKGIDFFLPYLETATQKEYYFSESELCGQLYDSMEMLDQEYKGAEYEIDLEVSKFDYVKLVNILAHSLYIEKLNQKIRRTCVNSVMLETKNQPSNFCSTILPGKVDLTLWNDKAQMTACNDSMRLVEDLKPLTQDCLDPDAPECSPCQKIYDSIFQKYDNFVEGNLVKILSDITSTEQFSMYSAQNEWHFAKVYWRISGMGQSAMGKV